MAGRTIGTWIARGFPELRLFLRSDTDIKYVRLSPLTQVVGLTGGALLLGWTIVASAILLMDGVTAGSAREQGLREKAMYDERLNLMSAERDLRAEEAAAAHERFSLALAEVSAMQTRMLDVEERRKELETGMDALRGTLGDMIAERDEAIAAAEGLQARLDQTETTMPDVAKLAELGLTVDHLSEALSRSATDRDALSRAVEQAEFSLAEMELESQLLVERNDRIFRRLEEAVSVSLEPLDEMFEAANLPADRILDTVRRGYTGKGGPLTPISYSTSGAPADADTARANEILSRLERVNLYRLAVEKTPFAEPVSGSFRHTSGFGRRWGRMHEGTDFAGAHGSPIRSTADGTVSFAGRQSGYGNIIKIKHALGIETRYAHLSRIRVTVGQKVSRGELIGDMGNTGRSTGTHLHYEVRVDGNAVNPMTYIKAARNVF